MAAAASSVEHLDHRAQLLAEQQRQVVARERVEVDVEARAAGEGHLEQRDEQAAVGAVVVGEQQAARAELLDGREEAL